MSSSLPERFPIAIAGIGCRFPGAVNDEESFWNLLCEGRSAITEVPESRWSAERYFSPDLGARGKLVTRWGGFVENLDEFDADFFSISPREAARMDPQHRWLLEITWEALEDALCPPSRLRGTLAGVFLGLSNSDYGKIQSEFVEQIDGYTNIGNSLSIASNRIAYHFDLKGPALSVDTACSSALVAVNLACESIWSGTCESAFAGGASALILPDGSMSFSKAGMLSPTGRCHAFDARANGYVRSEGAGIVFLKPLDRAIRDGNRIHAVIRASVVNQDGRTSSMTVPSVESQRIMIESALADAGLSPAQVDYVEAHGTGTPIGDPVEARALGEVLSRGRPDRRECLLGSVKTNLGHLEPASGIAGLIKAALIVKHGKVPPSLNFSHPNPNIPFESLKLRVATELTALNGSNGRRPIAAVNSFGFGGTNAHVVLEGPPPRPTRKTATNSRPLILTVSARSEGALRASAREFLESIVTEPDLRSFCATAALGRESLERRLAVMGSDAETLAARLLEFVEAKGDPEEVVSGFASRPAHPVFVFTGQGSQWWAMGRDLLDREPVFRNTVEKIDRYLQPLASWSLLEELQAGEEQSRIDRTDIAQPALFALQAGLVSLWRHWGVIPSAVVGHSVGEVAAAWVAGVFTLRDATELVFHRSRLQETTGGTGRMFATALSEAEARERIERASGQIEIAAINSSSLVTLAGDTEPLEELAALLAEEGKFVHRLPVDYAFHTRRMDTIEEGLKAALAFLKPNSETIPFFSTVEGAAIPGESLDADYWWRNVREPVQFASAIDSLMDDGEESFLEIGPHPALASSIRAALARKNVRGHVFHSLRREADDSFELARNFAELHSWGVPVDWKGYLGTDLDPAVALPFYAWQRKRHWLESPHSHRRRAEPFAHPLLGERTAEPEPRWEILLDPRAFPFLKDHCFWNRIVFPGAAYAELGLAVGAALASDSKLSVEELEMENILIPSTEDVSTLRVEFETESKNFRIFSRQPDSETWTPHATGKLVPAYRSRNTSIPLNTIRSRLPRHLAHWDFYEDTERAGYEFGPLFRQVEQVWHGDNEALSQVIVPEELEEIELYRFHPAILDACFHGVRAASAERRDAGNEMKLFLPTFIGSIQLYCDRPPQRFWVHTKISRQTATGIECNLAMCDDSGEVFAEIREFRMNRVHNEALTQAGSDFYYQFRWEACSLPPSSGDEPGENHILLLADQGGVAGRLEVLLAEHEFSVSCIHRGDEALTETLKATRGDMLTIVHLRCLDHPDESCLDNETIVDAEESGPLSLLHLAQVLQRTGLRPRVLVAASSSSGKEDDSIWRLASAGVPGFLRVAASEFPQIKWASVLLDECDPPGAAQLLLSEIAEGDGETEIAFRNGVRYARRLQRVRLDDLPRATRILAEGGASAPFRLENEKPGYLDRLALNETVYSELEPDGVEVRVASAGINFRDLMKALAMYPGDPAEWKDLGDDFAGTVTRVGERVDEFRPGDRVVGMSGDAFRSDVVANRRMLFTVPDDISFTEAAGIPTVFLTAHHAIRNLARMQPGESILIHAAAGGVGLAAIQVARSIGLDILATAGSEEKRRYLRELGIDRVMDSRSLAFAGEVMEYTGGKGVDAVLNSLAGDFLIKSLSVLAPFGRFLEIGKIDIFADRKLGMRALKNNITCIVVDMAKFLEQKPGAAATLFQEIASAVSEGIYRPIPSRSYPADRATDAFRDMARARHIGKLTLDFAGQNIRVGRLRREHDRFREDATYLVAGGANGFGFEVAEWLVRGGARHIVLLSRSGPGSGRITARIEALQAEGITVRDERVDIADEKALRSSVASIEAELPLIGGIFHAAMVLDDRLITELDRNSFDRAFRPKTLGAWNLHLSTLHRELDFFVCFSSFAGVIGAFKQANYNAGNTFLDELARYRRSRGLHGLSIDWGALSGAGYVDRNQKTRDYLETIGVGTFPVEEALDALGNLLERDAAQVVAAKVDWKTLGLLAPGIASANLYRPIMSTVNNAGPAGAMRSSILAAPEECRRALVEDFLTSQVAAVFGADAEGLDRTLAITKLGLDSLMAVELLNRIENELAIQFPMGSILNGPSIEELSGPVLDALEQSGEETASREVGPDSQIPEAPAALAATPRDREHSLSSVPRT